MGTGTGTGTATPDKAARKPPNDGSRLSPTATPHQHSTTSPTNSTKVTKAPGDGVGVDDWVAHTAPGGKRYFYSASRKKSIWADQRPDIKPVDDMKVHKTPDGRSYTYSTRLRKSFWLDPGASATVNGALFADTKTSSDSNTGNMHTATSPTGHGSSSSSNVSNPAAPASIVAAQNDGEHGSRGVVSPPSSTIKGPATSLTRTTTHSAGAGQASDDISPDSLEAWRHHKDPKSGKIYFYNKVTRASSWTRPQQWSEHVDPFTDKFFYKQGNTIQHVRPVNAVIIPSPSLGVGTATGNGGGSGRRSPEHHPNHNSEYWVAEMEQLLQLPEVKSQLNSIMRHWPMPKVLFWAQRWKPEEVQFKCFCFEFGSLPLPDACMHACINPVLRQVGPRSKFCWKWPVDRC